MKNILDNKKQLVLALVFLGTNCALAQQPVDLPPQTLTRSDISANPISILPTIGEGRDFVNFNAFAHSIFDSTAPVFQNGIYQGNATNSLGFQVGGGVTLSRITPTEQFLLGYNGSYNYYTGSNYPSGTNQNLSLSATKQLGRRWTLFASGSAGIFFNGGNPYPLSTSLTTPNIGQGVVLNPFSQNTKYTGASISLSYQQSLRWSYTIGGDFFLSRYYGYGSFGSTGGDGLGSITYRMTRLTSISGTYQHSYYTYQNAAGSSTVDNVYLTLSHDFHRSRWRVGVSGGMARVNSQGTFFIPGFLPPSISQQLTGVVIQGSYKTTSWLPSFQGSASRAWKHTALSITGGQSVNSGNGIYLTSRNLFLSGYFNIGYRRSNLSFGGTFTRLSSISNTISSTYGSMGANATYTYRLTRYIGLNTYYNLTYYSNIGSVGGRIDNNIGFGVIFASGNVPFSYF